MPVVAGADPAIAAWRCPDITRARRVAARSWTPGATHQLRHPTTYRYPAARPVRDTQIVQGLAERRDQRKHRPVRAWVTSAERDPSDTEARGVPHVEAGQLDTAVTPCVRSHVTKTRVPAPSASRSSTTPPTAASPNGPNSRNRCNLLSAGGPDLGHASGVGQQGTRGRARIPHAPVAADLVQAA
jgi:hypothetical protein